MLSRFEVARIVGVRAMQLAEGSETSVTVTEDALRWDYNYVAALELYMGLSDVCIQRGTETVHVSSLRPPPDLVTMINTRDGGTRT